MFWMVFTDFSSYLIVSAFQPPPQEWLHLQAKPRNIFIIHIKAACKCVCVCMCNHACVHTYECEWQKILKYTMKHIQVWKWPRRNNRCLIPNKSSPPLVSSFHINTHIQSLLWSLWSTTDHNYPTRSLFFLQSIPLSSPKHQNVS